MIADFALPTSGHDEPISPPTPPRPARENGGLPMSTVVAELPLEVDYEGLTNASLGVNMAAGALAGISEHGIMFPIDSIKTRMQVYTSTPAAIYTGMGDAYRRISSLEGHRRLWRGVWSVVLGAGPAHAVYFGTYEAAKEMAGGNREGHQFAATALAGGIATTASDALMNPFDVVKQRLQVHGAVTRTVASTFRRVYQTEGLGAFFVSYPTTLVINIPLQAIQFSTYEFAKATLNPSNVYSPSTHILAGGFAGALAHGLTTPLDVAKTLLQTRGHSDDAQIRGARGFADAASIIYKRDGARGFFRGVAPRMTAAAPSNAICWACYELFKHLFKAS